MARPDEALPRWSQRLLSDVDAADQRAIALARSLTPHQLNWKPQPEVWSVGQCLEHLSVSSEVYLDPIARALADRDPSPVQEITLGRFSRWFIGNYIAASEAPKRARAPKSIAPSSNIDGAILDRFLRSNVRTRDLIRRASAYDVNRIRFTNPFVPLIRFTVGTGLEIITKHEGRHLLQAERIRATAGFPSGAAA